MRANMICARVPRPATIAVNKWFSCALGVLLVAPAVLSITCPPLQSTSVDIKCKLGEEVVNCSSLPSAPGTVATFRCRNLHHFLFDYLPAAGYESRCLTSGEWSLRPFRCVPICGRPTGEGTPLVRGGKTVASAAEFPWHVTVYVAATSEQICGGSLITSTFFVSAAHCFYDNVRLKVKPHTLYMAAFGKTKRIVDAHEPHEQFRDFKKIYVHGEYGAEKLHFTNDIALVELARDVDITAWTLPVCVDWGLALEDLRDGEEGTVIGFGATPSKPTTDLQYARLPFVRGEKCRKLVIPKLAIFAILPDKFCVGFVNRTTVGKGDSGGGLSFPTQERQWFLRGLVSVGSPQVTSYSFFTDVGVFVPWMSAIIRQGEVSGRRCGVDVSDDSVVSETKAGLSDFPWELDIYARDTPSRSFERLWSGVLVKPNLVITVRSNYNWKLDTKEIDGYPASSLRVVSGKTNTSVDIENAGVVSEVVQLFAPYEEKEQTGIEYNIILLELKEPLNVMPVCVDWEGNAVLSLKRTGTAFHEKHIIEGESSRSGDTRQFIAVERYWRRYPILTAAQCRSLYRENVDNHNLCTIEEKTTVPSAGLLVNVDNTWFLRGIVSYSWPYTATQVYTDVTDRVVLQWLAKTMNFVGRPTCGNVDLCETLTPRLSAPGHMPWTVAVVVRTGTGAVIEGSGVLVHPTAVITDTRIVVNAASRKISPERPIFFPKVPAANITVLSISAEGKTQTSKVALVHLYKDDVALLDLDPETPIYNTPVCLDLGGNSLQLPQSGELGLVETWKEWRSGNHTLVSAAYVARPECSKLLVDRAIPLTRHPYSYRTQFCTTMESPATDRRIQGGAFLVKSGAKWFVQGLFLRNIIQLEEHTLAVANDFRDTELREWLQTRLSKVKSVQSSPVMSRPKYCVAGHASSNQDCGVFLPRNALGVVDLKSKHYLEKPSINHMEWYVTINCGHGDGCAGAVIHPRIVVTTVWTIHDFGGADDDGSAKAAYAKTKTVHYFYGGAVEEVATFHRRQRSKVSDKDYYHHDLVLLVLKAALPLMPVCLPPHSAGRRLPALAGDSKGLVETDRGSSHVLIPVQFWPHNADECRYYVSEMACHCNPYEKPVSADEFCDPGSSKAELPNFRFGAPFTVMTNGTWYLRGVRSDRNGNVTYFHNLDDDELLVWLHEKRSNVLEDLELESRLPSETNNTPSVSPQSTSAKSTSHAAPVPQATSTPPMCGRFVPWDEGDDADIDFYLAHPTVNHMEWHVDVNTFAYMYDSGVYVGVLVRPNMVITFANVLDEEDPLTAEKLTVSYSPDGGSSNKTTVKVKKIHVRRRTKMFAASDFRYDLALLELESALPLMPVCVASPGSRLPPLANDDVGLVELDGRETREVAPVHYRKSSTCNELKVLSETVVEDKFCGDFLGAGENVNIGSAFVVQTNGTWFVRGVRCADATYSSGSRHTWNNAYLFCNMDDDEVLLWLHTKMAEG